MSARTRRWMFGAAAFLAVANLAAYFVYTLPRSLQKRNVATRVEQLKGELAEQHARVAALKERAEAIDANRKDSRVLLEQRAAVAGAALGPLLEEVERIAKQQGLAVGSQGFNRKPVEGLPIDKFEIRMPIAGTYDQVTGLLVQLERSPFFMTLDEITAREQASGGPASVALDLSFSAYFRGGAEVAKR